MEVCRLSASKHGRIELYILPQPATMDLDRLHEASAGQWPSNGRHNKSTRNGQDLDIKRSRKGNAKSGFQYLYPYIKARD